jgi:energy-coupling factor transporter ATP-binding protein EcfA2
MSSSYHHITTITRVMWFFLQVGPNGAGKSTLLNLIMSKLLPNVSFHPCMYPRMCAFLSPFAPSHGTALACCRNRRDTCTSIRSWRSRCSRSTIWTTSTWHRHLCPTWCDGQSVSRSELTADIITCITMYTPWLMMYCILLLTKRLNIYNTTHLMHDGRAVNLWRGASGAH